MSEHTPGPWRHVGDKVGHIFATDCVVAKVGDFADKELLPFNKARWLADCKLIAAAPEMLEALKQFEGAYPMGINPGADKGASMARAAIAKAEGRK